MSLPSPALATPHTAASTRSPTTSLTNSPARSADGSQPGQRAHAATIAASVTRLLEENPQHRIGAQAADSALIGTTTHAVLAILAPIADQFTAAGLVEVTMGLSRGLCAPGRQHRRNSTLIAGFAADYLRGAARPRSPWACVDAEAETDGGFVDLVWRQNSTGLVFVDEIKTTNTPRRLLDQDWLTQTARYATAGESRWGDKFIGVRLVPLGSMHLAALMASDGTRRPITPTVANPLAGAGTW